MSNVSGASGISAPVPVQIQSSQGNGSVGNFGDVKIGQVQTTNLSTSREMANASDFRGKKTTKGLTYSSEDRWRIRDEIFRALGVSSWIDSTSLVGFAQRSTEEERAMKGFKWLNKEELAQLKNKDNLYSFLERAGNLPKTKKTGELKKQEEDSISRKDVEEILEYLGIEPKPSTTSRNTTSQANQQNTTVLQNQQPSSTPATSTPVAPAEERPIVQPAKATSPSQQDTPQEQPQQQQTQTTEVAPEESSLSTSTNEAQATAEKTQAPETQEPISQIDPAKETSKTKLTEDDIGMKVSDRTVPWIGAEIDISKLSNNEVQSRLNELNQYLGSDIQGMIQKYLPKLSQQKRAERFIAGLLISMPQNKRANLLEDPEKTKIFCEKAILNSTLNQGNYVQAFSGNPPELNLPTVQLDQLYPEASTKDTTRKLNVALSNIETIFHASSLKANQQSEMRQKINFFIKYLDQKKCEKFDTIYFAAAILSNIENSSKLKLPDILAAESQNNSQTFKSIVDFNKSVNITTFESIAKARKQLDEELFNQKENTDS